MNNIATSNLLFYDLLPVKNSGRIRVVYLRNSFDGSPVIYSRKMRTDSLFLYLQNLKTILAQQWSHHFTGKYKYGGLDCVVSLHKLFLIIYRSWIWT